ncbi:hypothetical protein N7478_007801 [Penicillium angulare]|uniref:uncharacterized protein n=1 Tax=Penicillium angulare TaxID=116970 RepID=UPI0025408756|nr:uncharacterized protein N7478_007801 [Penicillium angulare]KAJ5272676.1 hypothetical protein N7478_007801 [Penicillium angulare]
MIHVTRSFLLSDFTDLSRRPRDPTAMISIYVQKCIQAAEDTMTLIDSLAQQKVFIQSFWFTHYVCFCAILVVYIYIIQQHRQSAAPSPSAGSPADTNKMHYLFGLAETCQQHLAEATRKNCPSRRYSIILEELRREVHRQIGSDYQCSPAQTCSESERPRLLDPGTTTLNGTGQPVNFDAQSLDFASMPAMLQPPELGINPIEDAGLIDSLEASFWWAQLDSWALSNFPSDPSGFNF